MSTPADDTNLSALLKQDDSDWLSMFSSPAHLMTSYFCVTLDTVIVGVDCTTNLNKDDF